LGINTSAVDTAAFRVSAIVANAMDLRGAVSEITSVVQECGAGVPQIFRDLVAQQIAHATALDDLRHRNCGLRYEVLGMKSEIETRKYVDRARGILARKHRVSDDEAEEMLRRQSRQSGRSLSEVANSVVNAHRAAVTLATAPVRRTA
jgi:hypothetical protein